MDTESSQDVRVTTNDIDDTPRSSDIMIHTVPEITKGMNLYALF